MEPVHVLLRPQGVEHALGVDLARQGELHEDPVDLDAPVEVLDPTPRCFVSWKSPSSSQARVFERT
jgi:hypothetical protein